MSREGTPGYWVNRCLEDPTLVTRGQVPAHLALTVRNEVVKFLAMRIINERGRPDSREKRNQMINSYPVELRVAIRSEVNGRWAKKVER